MVEIVKRYREQAAILTLVLATIAMVLSLVQFALAIFKDRIVVGVAALEVGGGSLPMGWVILIVGLALSCALVKPPSERAARLVKAGALIITIGVGLGVVFLVLALVFHSLGVFATILEVTGAALELALKAAAAWLLWRVLDSVPGPSAQPGTEQPAVLAATGVPTAPGVAPVWEPDEAVGAEWHRAGDAATGAVASVVGTATDPADRWTLTDGQDPVNRVLGREKPPALPSGTAASTPSTPSNTETPETETPATPEAGQWLTASQAASGMVAGEPAPATEREPGRGWEPVAPPQA